MFRKKSLTPNAKNAINSSFKKMITDNAIGLIMLGCFCVGCHVIPEAAKSSSTSWGSAVANACMENSNEIFNFVRFRDDVGDNEGSLIIDVFEKDGQRAGETLACDIKVRLTNSSTNNVIILLDSPAFTLRWADVRTKANKYILGRPIALQAYPHAVDSVFLPGFTVWKNQHSFATYKEFQLTLPDFSDFDDNGDCVTIEDDCAVSISQEQLRARVNEEGFISGTVELQCDIVYYIVGENRQRYAWLERPFLVKFCVNGGVAPCANSISESIRDKHL